MNILSMIVIQYRQVLPKKFMLKLRDLKISHFGLFFSKFSFFNFFGGFSKGLASMAQINTILKSINFPATDPKSRWEEFEF